MANQIDKVYGDAVSSGLLPGVSVIAGDKNGECNTKTITAFGSC